MLKNLIFLEALIVIGGLIFYIASTRATRRDVGHLPAVMTALMAAIVFLSPTLVIVHVAIGLIPMLFGRTKLKVGMIVAMGTFAVPALPVQLTLGGAYLCAWSVQSTLGLSGLVALLIAPGKIPRAPPWADITMFVVVTVFVIIDARGGDWIGFLRQFAFYTFVYLIPVFVITRSARNAAELRILLTAMAGLGVILAVIILYEARGSWPLYLPVASHFDFASHLLSVKWRGGMIRAYGPMGEATQMGCVIVICFAAALSTRKSFIPGLAYMAVVSIIAVGILAPQSRGGVVGLAVAFIVSSFYRRGISGMQQVGAAAALLGGAYSVSLLLGADSQINASAVDAQSGTNYRTELLRRGMQEFWKSPIFGDNFTTVMAHMQDMVQGEGIVDIVNVYLYVALFAGLIGLISFSAAHLLPMVRLFNMRRQLPPQSAERDVAGFCLALLVSAAVMIAFTAYQQRPSTFYLVAATIALTIAFRRRAVSVKRQMDVSVNPSAEIAVNDRLLA